MYDPIEVDISANLLEELFDKCKKKSISIALIGGWATHFYVNRAYKSAFGKDYMGSRDIDICFEPSKERELKKLILEIGFMENGYPFRWEKVYNRETKKFLTIYEAKKEAVYNLIHIFLDIFCEKETNYLKSWNLDALKGLKHYDIEGFSLVDIDTLVDLKCVALFTRDKADKESKDACDLYALLAYGGMNIRTSDMLKRAIEKILNRPDLIYVIAQHVLLDAAKQNIVIHTLNAKLKSIA
ncbi:MAG TPA: hypothetical protein VJH95_01210 [Candidatus Nanoarchaeia archaeon]|nr:hypothetical protein [Candidatus Nanoarchaeia archaeon]